jgi:hypothetical protein
MVVGLEERLGADSRLEGVDHLLCLLLHRS